MLGSEMLKKKKHLYLNLMMGKINKSLAPKGGQNSQTYKIASNRLDLLKLTTRQRKLHSNNSCTENYTQNTGWWQKMFI